MMTTMPRKTFADSACTIVARQRVELPFAPPRSSAPASQDIGKARRTRVEGGLRTDRSPERADRDTALVSVVTACRNAEGSVQRAIDSVRQQTYEHVEHIIVDGASTDQTVPALILNRRHIEYFVSEPDGGIYAAINKGIGLSRGAYIVILNADDVLGETFIEDSLRALEATGADISYCDYWTESGVVHCPELNDGLLFSQLDVKHNTFLFRRTCFDDIGLFDESYRIVADAKWNRAAYFSGLEFTKIPGPRIFYSTVGASSSQTEEMRNTVIEESARLIRECFRFLDQDEARALYTSNFNNHNLVEVTRLFRKYVREQPLFADALRDFMAFNLARKPGYRANRSDPQGVVRMLDVCVEMGLPLSSIEFSDPDDPLHTLLSTLDRLSEERSGKDRCVVHFARKFSAPSEPFILAFINQLALRQPNSCHVMLCDERLLEDERPYDNVLCVPWGTLNADLRAYLYELIFSRLEPQMLVSHFALNGYWLFQRLRGKWKYLPMVNVCHGIDVFTITAGSDYYDYITQYAATSSRVSFTAVSEFLRRKLIESGVPTDKVFCVHNVISDAFFAHRKTSGYYAGDRPLRLLAVGRLIAWKGHDVLLRALARVKDELPHGFELTLVYGEWGEEHANLLDLAAQLGLAAHVELVEFVDFGAEPDFYRKFDLFVQPSTLSNDNPPRTDTFGVALLEAIAAGLPVITTTAGGLPEVAGDGHPQGVVVPHGDAGALANALLAAASNHDEVFVDNLDYARDRLGEFSADRQFERWLEAEQWVLQKRPKVYHFSALTTGGAAGATLNVHKGLLAHGYDSVFVTRSNEKAPPYVPNVVYVDPEFSFDFDQAQVKDLIKPRHTMFSIDDHMISDETLCELVADADVVSFSWFAQFVSTDNITAVARMGKPVVITLRDMNPITGGCHYFHGCEGWLRSCEACPQLRDNADEFPHLVLKNKAAHWAAHDVVFVALSEHSKAILERSAVARDCRIEQISNSVDLRTFYLEPKSRAREVFDFPDGAFLIGYLPSFNSLVKGHDELIMALQRLRQLRPRRRIVVGLAADTPLPKDELPVAVIQTGKITDPNALRSFYNAMDVVAVPSLEETFSNTTVEALACGAPVVGFQTGILGELLRDERLGWAAAVGDTEELAQALARLCDRGADRSYCHEAIRQRFSVSAQIAEYDALYASLREERHERRPEPREMKPSLHHELERALGNTRAVRKADGARRRLSGLSRRYGREMAAETRNGHPRNSGPDPFACDFDEVWLAIHNSKLRTLINQIARVSRPVLQNALKLGGRSGRRAAAVNVLSGNLISKDLPTPHNFDEEAYFARNPDVQRAVLAQEISSGYYHYVRFGRFEGRDRPWRA